MFIFSLQEANDTPVSPDPWPLGVSAQSETSSAGSKQTETQVPVATSNLDDMDSTNQEKGVIQPEVPRNFIPLPGNGNPNISPTSPHQTSAQPSQKDVS